MALKQSEIPWMQERKKKRNNVLTIARIPTTNDGQFTQSELRTLQPSSAIHLWCICNHRMFAFVYIDTSQPKKRRNEWINLFSIPVTMLPYTHTYPRLRFLSGFCKGFWCIFIPVSVIVKQHNICKGQTLKMTPIKVKVSEGWVIYRTCNWILIKSESESLSIIV